MVPVQQLAIKNPEQLAGWVDGLAAKGIEPRYQNLVLHPYASMTGRELFVNFNTQFQGKALYSGLH